jgi:acetyl esterase/lipase
MRSSVAVIAVRASLAASGLCALALAQGCGGASHAPPATTPLGSAPVAPAITADPDSGPARATMIMVHGGGWVGHDAHAEALLMASPGAQLRKRGWRVVSIDYGEGKDGLRDVLDTVDAEIARKTSNGPLCLYGESAGAHLALVAAARRRSIDCVIGLGAPTDLLRFEADARGAGRDERIVAAQISRIFGTTAAEVADWDPVSLPIHADVLLMREGDDEVVPASQETSFAKAHPGTDTLALPAGDPADPSAHFVHGTISPKGREIYDAEVEAFADHALAKHRAER